METVEFLVVGGGPGGTPAAMALARAGRSVMLAESGTGLGGTCLFKGCIPSKIFRESASRLFDLRRTGEFGLRIDGAEPSVDWAAIQGRRHKILKGRSDSALLAARSLPGLQVAFGRARLTGPRKATLEMNGTHREIAFEKAILATGSLSNTLPVPGGNLPGILSSEDLIEIGEIPKRLVLIGAGPIGVEMAQIFHLLGSKVVLLEALPRILEPVDAVVADRLAQILKRDGIGLRVGVTVEAIREAERRLDVVYRQGDVAERASGDVVVTVVGRHPNVEHLGLENTGVRVDRHGVKVNHFLETDEGGIFALGDVVGQPMFAHWATSQALALARHLLGEPARFPKVDENSAVVFSRPEIGMAGLTEEASRALGMDVAVAEYDFRRDARAQITNDAEGLLRVVYKRDDRRIVGIHALVEGAADLTGEAAAVVHAGLTIEELASTIHPHPTLTESFGLAAQAALG